jgi:hypothetical protein
MRLKRYARRLRAFRKEMAVSGDDAVTERALVAPSSLPSD